MDKKTQEFEASICIFLKTCKSEIGARLKIIYKIT